MVNPLETAQAIAIEEPFSQLASQVRVWIESWVSKDVGPFSINGITRDLLPTEMVAAGLQELDAYQSMIALAAQGISQAACAGTANEAIESFSSLFDSKTELQAHKAKILKDLLKKTVELIADPEASTLRSVGVGTVLDPATGLRWGTGECSRPIMLDDKMFSSEDPEGELHTETPTEA